MTTQNHAVSMLPLSELRIDEKANVRKIGRGADPVLIASIKAIGLRTPLTVRKNGKGYVVIDGGQRLSALQFLQGEGKAETQVPCIITDEVDVEAAEVSLQLNIARQEMHEVDEYRAFADLAKRGIPVATIAKRFAKTERQVEQRLALGQLDEAVLQAYVDGKFNHEAVRVFTQAPSKAAQVAALKKILAGNQFINGYTVRKALGIGDTEAGKYLELVTEEAYLKRGGKVTRDLFGSDHVISDPKLMTAMVNELLDAKCKELVADGWKEATTVQPQNSWQYEKIGGHKPPMTPKEAKRVKEIETLMESETITSEEQDTLEAEVESIEKAAQDRVITPAIKAKSIVFVSVHHNGKSIEVDPRSYPKASPEKKKAAKEKAAAKAESPSNVVSQALLNRMGEQVTAAAQGALLQEPRVAMAALIAALTAQHSSAVRIGRQGGEFNTKAPTFETVLRAALKLSNVDQVKMLTIEVAKALNLRSFNGAPLDQPDHVAIINALDKKRVTEAMRKEFAAQDYFDSVPKTVIAEAVAEAMGKDHSVNVARMDKGSAAKFAAANLPKTKWLPKQLRTAGYDGPKGKPLQVITPKAAKKKAKR